MWLPTDPNDSMFCNISGRFLNPDSLSQPFASRALGLMRDRGRHHDASRFRLRTAGRARSVSHTAVPFRALAVLVVEHRDQLESGAEGFEGAGWPARQAHRTSLGLRSIY